MKVKISRGRTMIEYFEWGEPEGFRELQKAVEKACRGRKLYEARNKAIQAHELNTKGYSMNR
jgi:hypothetical protein